MTHAIDIVNARRRTVRIGIGALAIFAAGEIALPAESVALHVWNDFSVWIANAIAMWACIAASRTGATRSLRAAWICFAAAFVLWMGASTVWTWDELVRHLYEPFPSFTDHLSWLGGVLVLAGVFCYQPARVSTAVSLRELADLGLMTSGLVGLALELAALRLEASPEPNIGLALVFPAVAMLAVVFGGLCITQRALARRRGIFALVLAANAIFAALAMCDAAAKLGVSCHLGWAGATVWRSAPLLIAWAALEERWRAGDTEIPVVPARRLLAAALPVVVGGGWAVYVIAFGSTAPDLHGPRVCAIITIVAMMLIRVASTHWIARELRDHAMAEEARRWRLEARLLHAQKLEALGTLAGGVAHDFNNVLSAALASMFNVRRRIGRGEDPTEQIAETERALKRGTGLTDRLVGLAHRRAIDRREVPIAELLGEVVGLLAQVLPDEVKLRQHVAPDLPPLSIDPSGLEHALINLGLNARDALDGRGAITLSAWQEGTAIVFEVADDGPGIPPEVLPRVFDAFFTTKAPGKGSGLGLAMVKAFVTEERGTIDVESSLGSGARFRMRFPLAQVQPLRLVANE